MEIRTGSLTFSRGRGDGPRTEGTVFNFTRPVRQAVAGLGGTSFGFSARDDHHLGLVNLRLATSIDDDVVSVQGTLGVRDWSGEWDDDYEGTIQVVLLAELETVFVPANLAITGIEYNQAIQFFRSRLDPATARPDNAIGLVAGKDTVLRVYVDTQNDPGRPTVATVSGELQIRLGGGVGWNTIAPLNGPIAPKRDFDINRLNVDDTLNFEIPGAFSTGQLDYRVRVFDAAHANQPGYTSSFVQGTVRFEAVQPLLVRGVGVHYTGKGLDIVAPMSIDLQSTLGFVRKTYPVGQVVITGFDVIDYDGDFTDQSGDGCGSGWDGLLDRLREMQGDSDDIYYGLVPAGVPLGWGGCGGGDGRVAAGPVGAGATAAQEIAHAFDRDHAPCGDPGNSDPSYPVYDALPSGSIGEVGMDGGTVQDPSSTFDFMSYCGPMWVSPYTFDALRARFPAALMAAATRQSEYGVAERRILPSEHLFLRFRIYRGGVVEVFPSFHYAALPRHKSGRWTPYGVELRDRHNRVLQAQRVWLTDPHKDLDSAWVSFLKAIPFDDDTARVVFTCGSTGDCAPKELLAVNIARQAPEVRIITPRKEGQHAGRLRVAWEARHPDPDRRTVAYLLRYSNDGGRNWRAVAPPFGVTEWVVDLDRLPGGERCRFQVLATDGVRTGRTESDDFSVPVRPRQTVIAPIPSGGIVPVGSSTVLAGESFSPHFGSAPPAELEWYSDVDGPLGKGNEVRLKSLTPGVHRISLGAPDGAGDKSVASVQIDVRPPVPRKHTSLTHPGHSSKDHDTGKILSKPDDSKGRRRHGD